MILQEQAAATKEVMKQDRGSIGNTASKLFVNLTGILLTTEGIFNLDAPIVHDPTTVCYLINPSIVELKPMYVEVELKGQLTYGKTVCDYYGVTGKKPNAMVATKLDFQGFWNIVYDAIKLYK